LYFWDLHIKKTYKEFTLSTKVKQTNKYYEAVLFLNYKNKKQYWFYYSYQEFNLIYLQNIYKINLKQKSINSLSILPAKLIKNIL
jgi:hypothetical protein